MLGGFGFMFIISIHALHEESDSSSGNGVALSKCISIHALHEESDRAVDGNDTARIVISIHALHEESDYRPHDTFHCVFRFQSTLSMRRAT